MPNPRDFNTGSGVPTTVPFARTKEEEITERKRQLVDIRKAKENQGQIRSEVLRILNEPQTDVRENFDELRDYIDDQAQVRHLEETTQKRLDDLENGG